MIDSAEERTMREGIANPAPANEPEFEMMNVLMPTSWPCAFTSGPPELPGLIAASVWINPPGFRASSEYGLGRFTALTMPRVTENWKYPNGLPNANTVCPGSSLLDSPQ